MVAPAADARHIELTLEGSARFRPGTGESLTIGSAKSLIRFGKPTIYQRNRSGEIRQVAGRYRIIADGRKARFEIAVY